jgi:subtilisin family serine protease
MKKQYYFLIIGCLLIVMTSFGSPQENKYYYAYDEKIILNEVEGKVLISYKVSDFTNIKNALMAKTETKDVEWQNDSICIVTIAPSQYKALKEDFLKQKGIKSIQPLYVTNEGLEMGITDEIVVQFNKDVSQKEIDALHKKHYAIVKKKTDLYQLLSVPANTDPLEIANAYQLSGLVQFSHPNFIAKAELYQTLPTDTYFVNQFYLHNTGQTFNGHSGTSGADINAPEAWDITKGSSDIIIAVLDQGLTSNHPDLPNTRQIRLAGSNFGDGSANDPSPTGNDNHGNACAGVIAASHNSEGIAGIAPNCKIMPVRIFNSNGTGLSATSLADAITFAKDNGAHIISNSWGYNTYGPVSPNYIPAIRSAIEDAATSCVVVFCAGNTADHVSGGSGYVTFPANVNVAGVLTVGASDRYDAQANYSPTSNLSSSYNQIVDVVAPSHRAYSSQIAGETYEVWSIDIPGSAGSNTVHSTDGGTLPTVGSSLPTSGTNYLSYTGYFGGTSAACPQVAGIAALVLSVNPYLTQQQVADIIGSTARKAGSYSYQATSGLPNGTWNAQMGYGVVDAYAAVQAACANVNFTNQIVTANTTVTSCGDINVQNVKVQNGAKLILDAAGEVNIISDFEVELGSEFEINKIV